MSSSGQLVDRSSPSTSGSTTDVSEDSVECRLQPIAGFPSATTGSQSQARQKNKRKSSEPRKLKETRASGSDEGTRWLSDVEGNDKDDDCKPSKLVKSDQLPQTRKNSILNEKGHFILNLPFDIRNILGPSATTLLSQSSDVLRPEDDDDDDVDGESHLNNRNYKVMSRERRMEANARERTRVHTISAAFENLRRAVPSYSCHQKLSKLAILKIACSYIMALANLNDLDYSNCQCEPQKRQSPICIIDKNDRNSAEDQSASPTFAQCVDLCTKTIQLEGKVKKRKG